MFQVYLILEELPENHVYSSDRPFLHENLFLLINSAKFSERCGNHQLVGKQLAWGECEPTPEQRETLIKVLIYFCCRDICQTENDSKL